MTGFGAAPLPAGRLEASLEIRSVNGRHLKVNLRLPSSLRAAEEPLRALVAERLRRGTVDVTLRTEDRGEDRARLEVDHDRVREVLDAWRRIADRFSVPGEIDLALLARDDRILVERIPGLDELVEVEALERAAATALDQVVEMREVEGGRLATDLRARLAAVGRKLDAVEDQSPRRLERERKRLLAAVAELTVDRERDEDRVAREIALLADKWDLGEEIVRARSHLEAFEELLSTPGDEAVGKRLGFLGQELLREVNTIGSKANDAAIQHDVVEMKNEVETLREQIENVE
ncbi:MAG: YicC/YloC family endoribonuclease [Gemmatimonadota bacterium]